MLDKHTDESCGVSKAMAVLGGKWTLLIIRDLLDGARRFGELESSLEGISPRTLAARLKELEKDAIVVRDCSAGPAHPVYRLTERGLKLHDIIEQMRTWGNSQAA